MTIRVRYKQYGGSGVFIDIATHEFVHDFEVISGALHVYKTFGSVNRLFIVIPKGEWCSVTRDE